MLHDIPVVSPARAVPDLKDTMWRRFQGKWIRVGSPAPLCDIRMRLHVYEEPAPDFCFGLANTKDVCELTALMTNQYSACGLLERESELTEFDQLK